MIGDYSNCCADSLLLPPPTLLKDGYHILTADLGLAYGEHGEGQQELYGTPFVSHLEVFGGGMCAQAVALQATALWHNIAKGLHGIAEISMLADPDEAEWIHLGGMTADKLIRYFRSDQVKLQAHHQYVGDHIEASPEQITVFANALYSYVSSGIPVILPIDLGRMNGDGLGAVKVEGESIFARNRLPTDLRAGLGPRRRPHAVLLVGAHRTSRRSREFILNDPATYPFLKASGDQLARARRYAVGSSYRFGPLSFISVTPSEVLLPLLSVRDELPIKIGLYDIAELPSADLGHFRLFDFE